MFMNKDHLWHMETIKKYIADDEVFIATPYITVDTKDPKSVNAACEWWLGLTGAGGEGMVVKPLNFTEFNGSKLLQPG